MVTERCYTDAFRAGLSGKTLSVNPLLEKAKAEDRSVVSLGYEDGTRCRLQIADRRQSRKGIDVHKVKKWEISGRILRPHDERRTH